MERFSVERAIGLRSRARGALAGSALAVVAVGGGTPLLASSEGGSAAGAVVAATLIGSLLAGLWAGAPAARSDAPPERERWVSAGVAFALAAAVAAMSRLNPSVLAPGFGGVLSLLALVSLPVYSIGMVLPSVLAVARRALEAADEHPDGWGPGADLLVGALAGFGAVLLFAGIALLPRIGSSPLYLATSIALLLPLLSPRVDAGTAVEEVLHEVQTPLATMRVTEVVHPGERQPERRLYLDDEQESGELARSGAPTLAYVAAAESWLTAEAVRGGRYLFLGGGAYTLPRRIAERDGTASLTVVELDPEITRIAYRFFGVHASHRITTVHGDARAFLERGPAGSFDRIYMDVYAGSEAVPYHLVTQEAFAALRDRLAPGGAIGMNLIGVTAGPEALRTWTVVRTIHQIFPALALYTHLGTDFPDLQNLLLLAAADPDRAFPERISMMDRWPEHEWHESPAATVLRDLYPTSDARDGAAPSASRPGNAG
jgi:hypothetical protein